MLIGFVRFQYKSQKLPGLLSLESNDICINIHRSRKCKYATCEKAKGHFQGDQHRIKEVNNRSGRKECFRKLRRYSFDAVLHHTRLFQLQCAASLHSDDVLLIKVVTPHS